ncbi:MULTISPECIES: ProQ/FINO family protein [Halomonadaceae]|uniref:ProQ/FINO family protein n=1 Tax=Halomonadaceae TaxID=28256 RepID=UPI00200DF584|nr:MULTISPECIES: ProQ/FINO family protein [Halomonas]
MINPSTTALFDALETRAERGAVSLAAARATIDELQARIHELEAENARLREQGETRAAVPARSQGLAALMSRRPKSTPSVPPEALSSASSASLPRQVPGNDDDSATAEVAGDATSNVTEPLNDLSDDEMPAPQTLLDEWYRRYTKTFFKGHTRPLKVGIHEELVAREPWPDKLVRRALACYVHLPRYLKAVRTGAERVDLDGENAGEVTEGEARYARRQLDELRARKRSRSAKRSQHSAQEKGQGEDKKQGHEERKETKPEQATRGERLDRKLSELLAKHQR